MFNVTDNDEVLETDQDYVYEGMEGLGGGFAQWFAPENLDNFGNVKFNSAFPASPDYGTPILFQSPRTVQVGVKFTY